MRADRLLSILIIISQKKQVTGKELAEHFEVSLRTIYRDIEKIGEAGVPIAAVGGKGGGYYLMENYSLNNLFLNKNQLEPLLAVMNNLDGLFGKNAQFNDLIVKFETLQQAENMNSDAKDAEKLIINMSHFSMNQELKEYLAMLNQAVEESRLLKFDYINRKMEFENRIVEPIQIEFSDGHWHIIGFCRVRGDYRRFKLVRIRHMELGDLFTKREITREELLAIFRKSYREKSILVKLAFSDKIGEQLPEYFSKDKIRCFDCGNYEIEDYFPDDEGLKKFILGFGTDCEVLAPESFREEMKRYIEKVQNKYK